LEDQHLAVMGTLILVQGVLLLDREQNLALVQMGCLLLRGTLFYPYVPFTSTITWMMLQFACDARQDFSLLLKVLLHAQNAVITRSRI
jgi:hypothetical protein